METSGPTDSMRPAELVSSQPSAVPMAAEAAAKRTMDSSGVDDSAQSAVRRRVPSPRGTKHEGDETFGPRTKARFELRRGEKHWSDQSPDELREEVRSSLVQPGAPDVDMGQPAQAPSSSSSAAPAAQPARAQAASAVGTAAPQADQSIEDVVQPVVAGTPLDASQIELGAPYLDEHRLQDAGVLMNLVLASDVFPEEPDEEDVRNIVRLCLEMNAVDLAEVYSPASFRKRALQLGLSPGLAVDLHSGWNFNVSSHRCRCDKQLASERPQLLIASPPCMAFDSLQDLDEVRGDLRVKQDKLGKARLYWDFAVEQCGKQLARGGAFLFEHPAAAASWREASLEKLATQPGVTRILGPVCRWNLRSRDRQGRIGFVREQTAWMTNHAGLAEVLESYCECVKEGGVEPYRRVHLLGDLAGPAAQYAAKLVEAILRTLRADARRKKSSPTWRRLRRDPRRMSLI